MAAFSGPCKFATAKKSHTNDIYLLIKLTTKFCINTVSPHNKIFQLDYGTHFPASVKLFS
jgi:hypothetical protein